MKNEIRFLSTEEIIFIHQEEIRLKGGEPAIRDPDSIIACAEAPKSGSEAGYFMTIFEMAATYISAITIRHPFVDGNKRTAALSAIIFLELNGWTYEETYDLDLADLVLGFLEKKKTKSDLAELFRKNSIETREK